jgi:branched-chain amino acid transport system permease protein
LLTILPEVLRFLSDWRLAVYAAILVLVMLYRSDGLRRQGTAVYADSPL